jgi:hypothetical protein
MSNQKIDWKQRHWDMKIRNAELAGKIDNLEKIVSDQESAFRGQNDTIRRLNEARELDARLIADKDNVISAHERRMRELATDVRVNDQQIAILKGQLEFATMLLTKKDHE